MYLRVWIILALFCTACNNGDSYSRGYVISQSHETVEDDAMEPPVE